MSLTSTPEGAKPKQLSWSRLAVKVAAAGSGVLLVVFLLRYRRGSPGAAGRCSARLSGSGQFARFQVGTFSDGYARAPSTAMGPQDGVHDPASDLRSL